MNKGWYFNYGEQAGKSHIVRNVPCQDRALCKQGKGVFVAALSDGCGSSENSHYGAEVTVHTLCDYLIDHFDEVHDAEILTSRKMIVDALIGALRGYIAFNQAFFTAYRMKERERYRAFVEKHSEEEFFLESLNATALFAAEKDGKYIIGQIGDGVVGGVVHDQLKIIMEEKKSGEVNGTFYPANIYALAQKNPDWYGCAQFQLKKPKNADVSAFILTSDGVDSFFDLRVPFEKKYTKGVDKLFRCTVESASFEQSKRILDEQFLPALVNGSRAMDDCSVAVMVRGDYHIAEDGYAVTKYDRPQPARSAKEEEVLSPTPAAPAMPAQPQSSAGMNDFKILVSRVKKFIGKEADQVISWLKLRAPDLQKQLKVLELYVKVLDAIKIQGEYRYVSSPQDVLFMFYIYWMDGKIEIERIEDTNDCFSVQREGL